MNSYCQIKPRIFFRYKAIIKIVPQITLDYTANINNSSLNSSEIFSSVHQILNKTGGVKLENCKSRLLSRKDYYIADGDDKHGFVHLEISFLEGRSDEIKSALGSEILDYLQNYFQELVSGFNKPLNLQITVWLRDILRNEYFKYPEGTLSG